MRTRGNKLPDFNLHFKMRHPKKELSNTAVLSSKSSKEQHKSDLVSNILRPVPNINNVGQNKPKKRGRTRLELIPAFKLSDFPSQVEVQNGRQEVYQEGETTNSYYSSDNSDYEVRNSMQQNNN